jgi:8-oxo-dGTP diphosphatase
MIHAVVGVIQKDNKLLVAERPTHKPYAGYWEFPGGKVEKFESPHAALIRELQEELGINVLQAEPWFQHTHVYPDKTVLLDIWLVKDFTGDPIGKEKQQLRWITFPEFNQLNLLEGNIPLLEKIKSLWDE